MIFDLPESWAQGVNAALGPAREAEMRRGARRPYDSRSPWNVPILSTAVATSQSAAYIAAIADNREPGVGGGPMLLTSDVDQYAITVYLVDGLTPMHRVYNPTGGFFGFYDAGDQGGRRGSGSAWSIMAPVPAEAEGGIGSDGQVILWDPDADAEWAFWQLRPQPDGSFIAENGYRTNTGHGNYGRFADGLAGRGAGTTYLAGLVRPWEIERGQIDHALAFAYSSPATSTAQAPLFTYPASKSDGRGVVGTDAPEGTRIQLDPAKTAADLDALGLGAAAKIIAKALQTYGMYVVDNSGSSKLIMEARHTAGWGPEFTRTMLSAIPWSWFRVVPAPAAPKALAIP